MRGQIFRAVQRCHDEEVELQTESAERCQSLVVQMTTNTIISSATEIRPVESPYREGQQFYRQSDRTVTDRPFAKSPRPQRCLRSAVHLYDNLLLAIAHLSAANVCLCGHNSLAWVDRIAELTLHRTRCCVRFMQCRLPAIAGVRSPLRSPFTANVRKPSPATINTRQTFRSSWRRATNACPQPRPCSQG